MIATERHHVAVSMAGAFKALSSVEPPTAAELADKHAAEAAWKTARKALADYQASRRL